MLQPNNITIARPAVIEIRATKGPFDLEFTALWHYRVLLYFLIWREIKVRYKQAVIGACWAILQPIFAVLIFTVVFGHFLKVPTGGVPYPVFALCALLPWMYFAEAFRRAGNGLVDDAELIRKIYFPRLIIPLAAVMTPIIDFLLSFFVLLALMAWYAIVPTLNIVFVPLFLGVAMMLSLSVGLWLGPINARFRDIKHALPFLTQVWMYATPIVYPLSIVPEQWKFAYSLNPMVGVIEGFRWALLGQDNLNISTMGIKNNPAVHGIGLSILLVILALLVGTIYFKRMERLLADVI